MPFWKQSDDPWDRKPGKRPAKPEEPREDLLDSLKQWNEDRKTAAEAKREAKRLPPEPCPWCGKEMEQGYLTGGRDTVAWHPGIHTFDPFRGLDGNAFSILNEGGVFGGYYKTAWLCRECGKVVFDIPEPERVCDFPDAEVGEASETEQEEETSEE